MHWGKRKPKYTSTQTYKTKSGDTISLNTRPTSNFTKFLAKHIPGVAESVEKSKFFALTDKNGKAIGEMQLYEESKDSMNIVWLGVNNDQRGKGYATAAMIAAIQIAKNKGKKKVTLEVPGNSPDAHHIYSKLGFKDMKVLSEDDIVWGGLTSMELKIK